MAVLPRTETVETTIGNVRLSSLKRRETLEARRISAKMEKDEITSDERMEMELELDRMILSHAVPEQEGASLDDLEQWEVNAIISKINGLSLNAEKN